MRTSKIDTPTVSVILPTFNRATLLPYAVKSVLSQSFQDFELIVIDDGSTDETPEVVKKFNDNRLIYIRRQNCGRSIARNRAIGKARGRFIAFLDSDDEYLPGKLEMQVSYMQKNKDFGMTYTSAECIDCDGKRLDEHYIASVSGNLYKAIAFFRPVTITLPTVMVRREVIHNVGLFDEQMDRFEDTDMWRRISKRYSIGAIESDTCRIRTHATNVLISQNPDKITAAIEYYVAKVFREDKDVDIKFLKHGASGLFEYYGKAFVSIPDWMSRGIALLGRAILMCPNRAIQISGISVLSILKALVKTHIM